MEGVLQKRHTVIILILSVNTILLTDFQIIAVICLQGIFINMLSIVNLYICIEKLADILLVILVGNPTLTELQTDVVKGNLSG